MAWTRSYSQMLANDYVDLKDMPSRKTEYSVAFNSLAGGLNIFDLDYMLSKNETPEIKNLLWKQGALNSRDGQVWAYYNGTQGQDNPIALGSSDAPAKSCYERLWYDTAFIHAGDKLWAFTPATGETAASATELMSITGDRGSWFVYDDKLYYKNRGHYVVIDHSMSGNNHVFTAADALTNTYTPVTYINADPDDGAGDAYQPENRLSAKSTIWYTQKTTVKVVSEGLSCDVLEERFRDALEVELGYVQSPNVKRWWVNGNVIFTYDESSDTKWKTEFDLLDSVGGSYIVSSTDYKPSDFNVNYVGTPEAGMSIFVTIATPKAFHLPVSADHIESILVDDAPCTAYTLSADGKVVNFTNAPRNTVPTTTNSVKITYAVDDEGATFVAAKNSIMDCPYAITYGGTGALCVVMAGATAQPNAYFWNGQTSLGMNPLYFPMEQYQLAGDFNDPITGFGKQQSYLVILKERSVGRTTLSTEDINERLYIDMPYVQINAMIGCDLPWSVQLLDDNLVWANTRTGVYFLRDSSAAYENNVLDVSHKVNGTIEKHGLLFDVRNDSKGSICSMVTDHKYWLVANGHAWVWDGEISTYKEPAWFYLTNINAVGFFDELEDIWHVDKLGRLTHFEDVFADYGKPIDKVYKFAVQTFGTYDALKNVNTVLIAMRTDTFSEATLEYITDYERRTDLTDLITRSWRLIPRNLAFRALEGRGFAQPFRRRPFCRHVRHFTMRLSNNVAGQDLSIVSAQIFYNFQGRERARQ